MCKEGKNIYYLSRIEANMSRESVAELLSVSVESLGAYERGETRMPCDLVVRMSEVYNDPVLAYRHMSEACPVGKECLPKFEPKEEPTAVLCLQKEMADVDGVRNDMVADACNGTMSKFSIARKEVTELVGAGLAYLFSGKKRRTACAANTSDSKGITHTKIISQQKITSTNRRAAYE